MTRDVVHWFRRYYVVILRYASDDELSEHTSLTVLSGYDKQASHATSKLLICTLWTTKGHTTVITSPTTGESQQMSVPDCTLRVSQPDPASGKPNPARPSGREAS